MPHDEAPLPLSAADLTRALEALIDRARVALGEYR